MKALKTWVPLVLLIGFLLAAWTYGPDLFGRIAYAVEKGQATAARDQLVELSKRDSVSPMFVAVAKAVKPSVVEVRVSKTIREPDMEEYFRHFFNDESFGKNFRFEAPGRGPMRSRPVFGLGSGVIVDAENGYIVTNWHVVGGADKVEVVLADNRKFSNEWIRTDPASDLAIIKIKPDNLISAPLGDSDKMETGDLVLAVGAPSGLSQTVTSGIISALGRAAGDGPLTGPYQHFIQTDAAINHGNSGGPLVNMRGEVIGINNMIISSGGGNEGIGLAIPSNVVRDVMDQLVKKGKVSRGFLGVEYQELTDENLAKDLKIPDIKGVLVTKVLEGSAAQKAGVKVGDFIVAVDDKPVVNGNQLRSAVAAAAAGKPVALDVYRGGEKIKLMATLGEPPKELVSGGREGAETPGDNQGVKKYGVEVSTLTDELAAKFGYKKTVKGVIISDVQPNSDAAEKGLAEGMVILQVQGKEVTTPEEFAQAMAAAPSGVRLLVLTGPQGAQRFVYLQPKKEK